MNNKWSLEEIDFLKENYPKFGHNYCILNLIKNKNQIKTKVYKLKLNLNKDVKSKMALQSIQKIRLILKMFLKKQPNGIIINIKDMIKGPRIFINHLLFKHQINTL